MKRVWLYDRESTPVGAEKAEEHMATLRKYAEEQGYQVVGQSFDCCEWTSLDRVGLNEAIRAIKEKAADAIVVRKLNRIARNEALTVSFAEILGSTDALECIDPYDQHIWLSTVTGD